MARLFLQSDRLTCYSIRHSRTRAHLGTSKRALWRTPRSPFGTPRTTPIAQNFLAALVVPSVHDGSRSNCRRHGPLQFSRLIGASSCQSSRPTPPSWRPDVLRGTNFGRGSRRGHRFAQVIAGQTSQPLYSQNYRDFWGLARQGARGEDVRRVSQRRVGLEMKPGVRGR